MLLSHLNSSHYSCHTRSHTPPPPKNQQEDHVYFAIQYLPKLVRFASIPNF